MNKIEKYYNNSVLSLEVL